MELDDELLHAAAAIADRLVADALWGDGLCTWLSVEGHGGSVITLTPWLYAGDAGVALFLAEAARLTGSRGARDAARAATLRALASVEDAAWAPGLYEGALGVALAAGRVAVALDDEQIFDAARSLACIHETTGVSAGGDLMVGKAGDILALVTLAHELTEPALLTRASGRASEMIEAADTRRGLSWSSIDPHEPNLTGLAHGAASAVMACSELLRATGDVDLRHAVDAACAFERSFYDRSHGNWVDRRRHRRRRRSSAPDRFMSAWCHGGPGIALSRMSAFAATQERALLDEASAGTQVALRRLDEVVGNTRGGEDWSLCHGLSGLIDIVGEHEQLGASLDGGAYARARRIAADHATRLSGSTSWTCGTQGRQTPGLMVGLAGVGMSLLRMVDAEIRSVLWVRPQTWSATVPQRTEGTS